MFFDNAHLSFRVVDVLHIHSSSFRHESTNRHFCALSFRMETDAVIHCRGKDIHMQPHSISFFPADMDYCREASKDHMVVVHFDLINDTPSEMETFVTAHPQEMQAQFLALYDMWMKNRPNRQYLVTGMLYQLFAEIYMERLDHTTGRHPLLMKATRYMSRHFAESGLTIPAVAAHVGISESYLRRLFQQELLVSPKQYLLRQRVQQAVSLLGCGYYSVREVAHLVGFADEKYFSVVFRKAIGCPPSRYAYCFGDPT